MSRKLPALDGATVLRVLKRVGFQVDRINGSHYILRHADGRKTSVPVHTGKTLRRGLLASILKDVRLSADDLRRLL